MTIERWFIVSAGVEIRLCMKAGFISGSYYNVCCCLPSTSPFSVTKSWGRGFITSVSDYSEPRLCHLLLRIYYSSPPCLPLLPLDFHPRESLPPALSTNTSWHASKQDHPPNWASSISVPAYRSSLSLCGVLCSPESFCLQCHCPVSFHHSAILWSLWYPLPPLLTDSCCLRSRESSEIYFNVALSWASSAVCRHHGARLQPLTLYPLSCAQTSNMGQRDTQCATFDWRMSMYVRKSWFPVAFKTLLAPFLLPGPISSPTRPFPCHLTQKKPCGPPLSTSTWPLRRPISPLWVVVPHVQPLCKTPQKW